MMQGLDATVLAVRTTVNIQDNLLHQAKELATRSRRPLGEVVDDALRLLLSRSDEGRRGGSVELPTYGGSGVQAGVDLEDKDALSSLLDAVTDAGHQRAAG